MSNTTVRGVVVFLALGLVAVGCTTKKIDTADSSSSTSTASTATSAQSGTTSTRLSGPVSTAPESGSSDTVVAQDSAWDLNATGYRGQNGLQVSVDCPAGGTPYSVWGSGTYTDDSSICTAAVHSGLITLTAGGRVVVTIGGEKQSFTGSEAYGVTTSDYGAWGGSYTFAS
jgi:hypothetical protein